MRCESDCTCKRHLSKGKSLSTEQKDECRQGALRRYSNPEERRKTSWALKGATTKEVFFKKRLQDLLSRITETTAEGCWLYRGDESPKHFRFNLSWDGARYASHCNAAAYTLMREEIPTGLRALHLCVRLGALVQRPNCVNSEHLYLGNARDNARDYFDFERVVSLKT